MEGFDWKQTIKINIVLLKIVGLWPGGDGTYECNFYTFYEIFSLLFIQISHIAVQTVNLIFILNDIQAVTGVIFALLMEILGMLKAYCLVTNMKMLKQLMITVNSDLFQPKSHRQRNLIQPNLDAWKAILTYLHQFVAINCISLVNVNIDSLIAALNMYIGAQFDILCDDVRHLHDDGEDAPVDVTQKLKKCVTHHREILKFAENVNYFYNWLIFSEFFVGGICIGMSMFQLSVVAPLSSEFYSFISYTVLISLQVFMYCWFGNKIELKSSQLPYAVFESDWTDLSPEVKKLLIIFTLRIAKPLKMSAFGLFYLSLETFVRVIFLEHLGLILHFFVKLMHENKIL
ncbi:7tm 6 domain containing protein, partial [Asbolus verrucosus]